MKFTPARRMYGLGAILLVSLTICSRKLGSMGAPSFMIPLAVAGIAYLLAIRELFSTSKFRHRVIVIGLMLAAMWQVPFLLMPPGPDDDVHRYVWDGRVQRLGYNPYLVVPSDPALARLHTPETRTLNHPDLPSPYPAGAQLFFRGVTAIHESVFALKVAFVVCDLAIVFVLLDILRRSGLGAHWVLAYAWNPLLGTEVAGSGHIDIVGVLLLLVSVAALGRRWRAVAALAFGLAVAVKFLPIVLLPLYWKRVRIRDGALAAVVVGFLYVPFFNHGRIPIGSLGTYVQSFRFNDPAFALLERVASPQLVVGLAVLVGFLTAVWLRSKGPAWSAESFAWPMAASLLCAPVVYPWYLLWLLPFMRSVSAVPIIIWTVSIIPTYYVWHLRTLGRPWLVPGWIMLLEYGAVATAGAIIAFSPVHTSGGTIHRGENSMTNAIRATIIRLLAFVVLVLSTTARAQTRPPIAEQLAKAYGLDSWGQIEAIRYTFNLEIPGLFKLSRTWTWEPKADRVTYEGKDKAGNPVKVTYVRSQVSTQPDNVKNEIDPGFVNDQYWLVFPFHVIWDTGANVEDKGKQKLPAGKGSADHDVVVKYASGGYTPGDTWELFVGADNRVQQMVFHHGGTAKPSVVIATWAGYKKAGPLLVSTDHRGTADGKPLVLTFTDVAVKLTGSDTWIKAQ